MILHFFVSSVTRSQWRKVLKALVYSFTAGFVGTFVLQSADLIKAAHQGRAALVSLITSVIAGAVIGGLNALFVTIKQFFTLAPEQSPPDQPPIVQPDVVITPLSPTSSAAPIVAAPVTFTGQDRMSEPTPANIGSTVN